MGTLFRNFIIVAVICAFGIAYLSDNSADVEFAKNRYSLSDEQVALVRHCSSILQKRSRNIVVKHAAVRLYVGRELGCGCLINKTLAGSDERSLVTAKAALDFFAGREIGTGPIPVAYMENVSSKYGAEVNDMINMTTALQSAMRVCTHPTAYISQDEERALAERFENRPSKETRPWDPYYFEVAGIKGVVDMAASASSLPQRLGKVR